MATDVILDDRDGNWLTLSAAVVNCQAADLILDHPARRGAGAGGHRRALVHDQNDGLTLNYNRDFPGGVTLNGVKSISVHSGRRAGIGGTVSLRSVSELKIEGGISFLWDHGMSVVRGGGARSETVSLQAVIAALQAEVAALKQRVAALEA